MTFGRTLIAVTKLINIVEYVKSFIDDNLSRKDKVSLYYFIDESENNDSYYWDFIMEYVFNDILINDKTTKEISCEQRGLFKEILQVLRDTVRDPETVDVDMLKRKIDTLKKGSLNFFSLYDGGENSTMESKGGLYETLYR